MADVDRDGQMPRTYPDYKKLVKRVGLTYVVWVVVFIAVIGLLALVQPAHWVVAVGVLASIVGFVVALTLVGRSFLREERERRRPLHPSTAPAERPRLTLSSVVRAVGLFGLVFSQAIIWPARRARRSASR